METMLSAAVNAALKFLENPECSALYGTPKIWGFNSRTPSDILKRLKSNGDCFWRRLPGPPGAEVEVMAMTPPVEHNVASITLGVWKHPIIISPLHNKRFDSLVHTLLHELGHVARNLSYESGGFIHDDDDPVMNQKNNDLITNLCGAKQ